MTTKNIAIREDVYRKLLEAKRSDESFSDAIDRLLENKTSVLAFWGALADSKKMAEIEDEIQTIRRRALIRS